MQLSAEGNKIVMRIWLEMNKSVFEAEDYPDLKEFFKKLYTILEEPVVLKRKIS